MVSKQPVQSPLLSSSLEPESVHHSLYEMLSLDLQGIILSFSLLLFFPLAGSSTAAYTVILQRMGVGPWTCSLFTLLLDVVYPV